CFFFSSRRRHTSFSRDWSSDVCSSDLPRSSSKRPHCIANAIRLFEKKRKKSPGVGRGTLLLDRRGSCTAARIGRYARRGWRLVGDRKSGVEGKGVGVGGGRECARRQEK